MGAIIPGPAGVAVFVGIKFTGYFFAVKGLKLLQPVITAGAAKIAGMRTAVGLVLGAPLTFLIGFGTSALSIRLADYNSFFAFYASLVIARILIWALVIYWFARKTEMPRRWIWPYAFLGAILSSLLDWPGYGLAVLTPGKIVIC
ncbi:MAG TPA: hypothetical protein VFN26_20535 [Candidatus Acidoferrum sp.]|nr:hypothetical protein [Candidatus Acidoferrum sp.]